MSVNSQLQAEIDFLHAAWTSDFSHPRAYTTTSEHTHVEVHHDVFPFGMASAEHCRQIHALHLGFGWNGCFYNLGLDSTGKLWELRGIGNLSFTGDRSPLTVVLFGNYHDSGPDPDHFMSVGQIDALERLVGILGSDYTWHQKRVIDTGIGTASSCPGANAISRIKDGGLTSPTGDWFDMATLEELKTAVRAVLNEGTGSGQVSWASTSKAQLGTEQTNFNTLNAINAKIDALAVSAGLDPEALAQAVVDEIGEELAGP